MLHAAHRINNSPDGICFAYRIHNGQTCLYDNPIEQIARRKRIEKSGWSSSDRLFVLFKEML